ncbi:hypothetical protein [[Eubacterium] cellulosolvens]
MASSSSRVRTTVFCSASGTPAGLKLATGGTPVTQRAPRNRPLPGPLPCLCRGMMVYICELIFIGFSIMRGSIYSLLLGAI